MMDETWYDPVDTTPELVCLCELRDGTIVEAIQTLGTWESLTDGRAIYPVKYRPSHWRVVVPLYSYKAK